MLFSLTDYFLHFLAAAELSPHKPQRVGIKRYFAGLESFGITEKTGVDFPGEGSNIIQAESSCGPVELATMSYGQGIAVTPISIVTAVCSLANEGKLMQPHFLKELRDSSGNVVMEFEPQVKSISVSAQTASNMLDIMESVVTEGGAGTAKIAGIVLALGPSRCR